MFARCHLHFPNESDAFKYMLHEESCLFWGLVARATHTTEAARAKREIQAEIQMGVF